MSKSITILVLMVVILCSIAFGDFTGDIRLTDGSWNDIGSEYPAGTDTIYVEVYDSDISGSLEVTISSESDVEGEVLTLTETEPGLFRGYIPVDYLGVTLLSRQTEELELPQRVAELREEHPDWSDHMLERSARARLSHEAIASGSSEDYVPQVTREIDGLLQISTGEVITVLYVDNVNDYGNVQELEDLAIYGGIRDNVSGIWTAANSPYAVTGDIWVEEWDSLTIEPGVEVRFFGEYTFNIYGSLSAIGTEQDSIVFTQHFATLPSDSGQWIEDSWQGIYFGNWWSNGDAFNEMAYCEVSYANYAVMQEGESSLSIDNSYFHHNRASGIWINSNGNSTVAISNCIIEENNLNWWDSGSVMLHEGNDILISNSLINNNTGNGLYTNGHVSGSVSNCDIRGNTELGIYINPNGNNIHFTENNIYDNGSWVDVHVGCCDNSDTELDFMGNYWGEATTDEMNLGGNPKNIDRIYDGYDDNNRPVVNYAGWTGGSGASGYTGDLRLTDGSWNDIGSEYPAGTDTIYVEVYDSDISGSLEVTISSESDVEGEVLTLTETEPGLFRGYIPVDYLGVTLLSRQTEELELPQRVAELREEHPDWSDHMLERSARARLSHEAIASGSSEDYVPQVTREIDGLLQISTGEVITVLYVDNVNDYGNVQELEDLAIYGGIRDNVSGIWTAANSPYAVTGDIWVEEWDSLTIEPGVEVRFFGEYTFNIYGSLSAIGTEQDSIVFTQHFATLPSDSGQWIEDSWQGIYFGNWWSNGDAFNEMAYCEVSYANYAVMQEGESSLSIDNSYFHHNRASGIWINSNGNSTVAISNCIIEENNLNWWDSGSVMLHEGNDILISNSLINNNTGNGLYTNGHVSGSVSNCDIRGNTELGIYINPNGNNIHFTENNIYDNGSWVDVHVGCCDNSDTELDFMGNYWGEATTDEMNLGGNPKNIDRIYDGYDDNNRPVVNYAGWLQEPINPLFGDLALFIDQYYGNPGDTLLVAVNTIIPLDTSFISAEFSLMGFNNDLEYLGVISENSMAGDLGWTSAENVVDGVLYVALTGAEDMSGTGILCWLQFLIPDDIAANAIQLEFLTGFFNDGSLDVDLVSGEVFIVTSPVAEFEATMTYGNYPLNVHYTDLSIPGSSPIISWLWNFGDGGVDTVQNPLHVYDYPGEYDVSLIVMDEMGMSDTLLKPGYIDVNSLAGDVDFNSTIQAYDAGLILEHIVGYVELTDMQQSVGNVSLDATLSALDASLILQYVVHNIDSLPYDSSEGSLLVSGQFSSPVIEFIPGTSIDIPMQLEGITNLLSFQAELSSESTFFHLDSISVEETGDSFIYRIAQDSAMFSIAAARGFADEAQNPIFHIHGYINESVIDDTISISFAKFMLNETNVDLEGLEIILVKYVGVDEDMAIPKEYALNQNYPNPFNPRTTLRFGVPTSSNIEIQIFDIMGRHVRTLIDREYTAGWHDVQWNGVDKHGNLVSSGMYVCRLNASNFQQTIKMAYLK